MSLEFLLTASVPSIIQLSLQSKGKSKGKHCQVKAGVGFPDMGQRTQHPWNLLNYFHAYTLLITRFWDMLCGASFISYLDVFYSFPFLIEL